MRNNNNNNSAITWRPVTSESCDCSIAPPFVTEKASTFFFTCIREFTLKRTKSGQPASLCCCSAAAQPRWFTKRTLVGAAASVRRHRPRRLREIVDADFDGRRVVCTIEVRAAGVFHAALASIVCVTAEKKKFVKLNEEEKKARRNFKRLTAFHPQTRLNGGTQSRHSTAELRGHFKRELLETPRLLLVGKFQLTKVTSASS